MANPSRNGRLDVGRFIVVALGAFVFVVGLCLAHVPFAEMRKFDYERLFGFSLGFAFLVWALLSQALHGATFVIDAAFIADALDANGYSALSAAALSLS